MEKVYTIGVYLGITHITDMEVLAESSQEALNKVTELITLRVNGEDFPLAELAELEDEE